MDSYNYYRFYQIENIFVLLIGDLRIERLRQTSTEMDKRQLRHYLEKKEGRIVVVEPLNKFNLYNRFLSESGHLGESGYYSLLQQQETKPTTDHSKLCASDFKLRPDSSGNNINHADLCFLFPTDEKYEAILSTLLDGSYPKTLGFNYNVDDKMGHAFAIPRAHDAALSRGRERVNTLILTGDVATLIASVGKLYRSELFTSSNDYYSVVNCVANYIPARIRLKLDNVGSNASALDEGLSKNEKRPKHRIVDFKNTSQRFQEHILRYLVMHERMHSIGIQESLTTKCLKLDICKEFRSRSGKALSFDNISAFVRSGFVNLERGSNGDMLLLQLERMIDRRPLSGTDMLRCKVFLREIERRLELSAKSARTDLRPLFFVYNEEQKTDVEDDQIKFKGLTQYGILLMRKFFRAYELTTIPEPYILEQIFFCKYLTKNMPDAILDVIRPYFNPEYIENREEKKEDSQILDPVYAAEGGRFAELVKLANKIGLTRKEADRKLAQESPKLQINVVNSPIRETIWAGREPVYGPQTILNRQPQRTIEEDIYETTGKWQRLYHDASSRYGRVARKFGDSSEVGGEYDSSSWDNIFNAAREDFQDIDTRENIER